MSENNKNLADIKDLSVSFMTDAAPSRPSRT